MGSLHFVQEQIPSHVNVTYVNLDMFALNWPVPTPLASQLAEYSGKSYYAKGLYLPGIQECYDVLELSTEAKDKLRDKMPELASDD